MNPLDPQAVRAAAERLTANKYTDHKYSSFPVWSWGKYHDQRDLSKWAAEQILSGESLAEQVERLTRQNERLREAGDAVLDHLKLNAVFGVLNNTKYYDMLATRMLTAGFRPTE